VTQEVHLPAPRPIDAGEAERAAGGCETTAQLPPAEVEPLTDALVEAATGRSLIS
jgi:hypothetical protein